VLNITLRMSASLNIVSQKGSGVEALVVGLVKVVV
jgi:hypothetical protein